MKMIKKERYRPAYWLGLVLGRRFRLWWARRDTWLWGYGRSWELWSDRPSQLMLMLAEAKDPSPKRHIMLPKPIAESIVRGEVPAAVVTVMFDELLGGGDVPTKG